MKKDKKDKNKGLALRRWLDSKPKATIEVEKNVVKKKMLPRYSTKALIEIEMKKPTSDKSFELLKEKNSFYLNNKLYQVELLTVGKSNTFFNKDFPIGHNDQSDYPKMHKTFKSYKSQCLELLFRLNEKTALRLPGVIDEIIINGSNTLEVPSIIFLVKSRSNKFFFIWESLHDLKATYIFNCNNYQRENEKMQKIVDFIGSKSFKLKRSYLTKSKKLAQSLNLNIKIKHENEFEAWKIDLMKALV